MAAPSTLDTSLERRRERRISVRLPMRVRGTDERGMSFEESTASENVCRSGAAFLTRRPIRLGDDLEIVILSPGATRTPTDTDFLTRCRVVHIEDKSDASGKLVGVLFIGSRFNRVFVSESA